MRAVRKSREHFAALNSKPWSVLSGDAARWAVRAAIDADVAQAYGLTRDQYAHVLSTFSHSSYHDAPRQCLAAFDELQFSGLEAATREQATSIGSADGQPVHFSNFCPEVTGEQFGCFASYLARYADELDSDLAHERLGQMGAAR